jgi:hypothetical protein
MVLWIILLCSAAVFVIFALLSPETHFLDARGRDDWMNLIKTTTDIERLRNAADNVVELGWASGETAIWLCRFATVAFLIIMSGSIIGLFQIRKMKRHLTAPPNKSLQATAAAPASCD